MDRTFLDKAQPGDVIEDVFVFANKQLSTTASGKLFIKAMVSDRSSQVTARMWNATRELFNALPDNGFVRVRGKLENYQGNLQLIIEQVWPPKPGTYEPVDLIATTTHDIPAMFARVTELLGTLRNHHLSILVQAYLDDQVLMEQFRRAPAAQTFHHAFIGGLLEHTLNAMEVANAVSRFYPALNRDLVLVGIFLHDIAKTWELSYDVAFGYTDGGQLVGHVVKSAMWIEAKAEQASMGLEDPIPRDMVDVLQHIILSHHGQPEFGAARMPSTPEAIFVHVIENLDAKMMMSLSATRSGPAADAESNWTEYMKAIGGRLYRPDVAPADTDPPDSEPAPEPPAMVPPSGSPAAMPQPNDPQRERPQSDAAPSPRGAITNPNFGYTKPKP